MEVKINFTLTKEEGKELISDPDEIGLSDRWSDIISDIVTQIEEQLKKED